MGVDFSALIREEVASGKRSQWNGTLGGQTVTLYAKPLTPADNAKVLRKYPNFNVSMDLGGMAMYIALKAEDEDGNLAFSLGRDLPVLMRFGQNKIGELFQGLFADQVDDIDGEGERHEDRVGN